MRYGTDERYSYEFDPEGVGTAAQVVRLVGRGREVLELGCGPGSISRVMREYSNCRITAVERDPAAAVRASPWCIAVHCLDLNDVTWVESLGDKRFDVVVMADVLEHLQDPASTLRLAVERLRPEGYCVISVPNVAHNGVIASLLGEAFPYRATGLLDRTHLRFFARQDLPQLLEPSGLLMAECHAIRCPAHATEFAGEWFALDENHRRLLESNPQGDVYQFVIRAVLDTAPNRHELGRSMAVSTVSAASEGSPATGELLRHLHENLLHREWRLAELQDQLRLAQETALELRTGWFGIFARAEARIRRAWRKRHEAVKLPAGRSSNRGPDFYGDRNATDPLVGEVANCDATQLEQTPMYDERSFPVLSLDQRISLSLAQYDLKRLPCLCVGVAAAESRAGSPAMRNTLRSLQAQTYLNLQILFLGMSVEDVSQLRHSDLPWDNRWRSIPKQHGHMVLDFIEGDYLLLLREGDVLIPSALQELAEVLVGWPEGALLTFNHRSAGREWYLPGWSHEFHLARNAVGRAVLFSVPTLRSEVHPGFSGPIDAYALMLAMWAGVPEGACGHHPRCLLHHGPEPWGACSESLLAKCLNRKYPNARLLESGGLFQIRHPLPGDPPLVSVMIPTRNAAGLVRCCLDSLLRKTTYPNYEILLIDNASDQPEALELLDHYALDPRVTVLRDGRPFNFSALNNLAARVARGDFLLLLNNDTEVISPDWMANMLAFAQYPENGAIGARLWYPDNTLQHGGVVSRGGGPTHAWLGLARSQCGPLDRACLTQRYLAVTAACLLVRKQYYWRVGGFDEGYAVAFGDVDFCYRLHASGLRNLWVAEAELYHHESVSRGFDARPEKKARAAAELQRLKSRWRAMMAADPYA